MGRRLMLVAGPTALLVACSGGLGGAVAPTEAILLANGRTIELSFDTCGADPQVTVDESDDEVVLAIEAGTGTDDACADGAVVRLAQPLGDRRVLVDTGHGSYELDVVRGDGPGPPPTTGLSPLLPS